MANKPASETSALSGTLQRGKACLRCRKRKMKCDGAKPACQQCSRAKKAESCEYDDGKGKTRTQILRDTIARLELRIRELEDPDYVSPAITLHHPHHPSQSSADSSSSSLAGSPGSASLSASHSPFPSESTSSPQGSWAHLPLVASPSPSPFGDVYYEDPQPPVELAQMLLDIFAPHQHQCGLELHMGRLRDSVANPAAEQRHPALLNAIYLWACYVSRPEPLAQHEGHYLARTLEALGDSLQHADRLVDAVQASCLVALYFLSSGRIVEGSYHAAAAAALAVQCGLHGALVRGALGSSVDVDAADAFALPPPADAVAQGERVLAFWQVYNLDRCWSAVLQRPAVIPDGRHAWDAINTPWPQPLSDYEAGRIDDSGAFQTVRAFFDGALSGGFSVLALRAKASALFERAHQLALNWDPHMTPTGGAHDAAQALEHTLATFVATLAPAHTLAAAPAAERHALLAAHTLAHAARAQLHAPRANESASAHAAGLHGARAAVAVIKHIADADVPFLDPIVGPCWAVAADTLIRELDTVEATWPLINSSELRGDIATVLYALNGLAARFPLLGIPAAKISKRLAHI